MRKNFYLLVYIVFATFMMHPQTMVAETVVYVLGKCSSDGIDTENVYWRNGKKITTGMRNGFGLVDMAVEGSDVYICYKDYSIYKSGEYLYAITYKSQDKSSSVVSMEVYNDNVYIGFEERDTYYEYYSLIKNGNYNKKRSKYGKSISIDENGTLYTIKQDVDAKYMGYMAGGNEFEWDEWYKKDFIPYKIRIYNSNVYVMGGWPAKIVVNNDSGHEIKGYEFCYDFISTNSGDFWFVRNKSEELKLINSSYENILPYGYTPIQVETSENKLYILAEYQNRASKSYCILIYDPSSSSYVDSYDLKQCTFAFKMCLSSK